MGSRIDLSSLTRTERWVLALGMLLFLNGMLPWWYRVTTEAGSYRYNAGLKGWGVLAVAAGAAAALGVLARASVWPQPAPGLDGAAYTLLGALALGATVVQLTEARAPWIGIYVSVALAAALTLAGARRLRERRAGWT